MNARSGTLVCSFALLAALCLACTTGSDDDAPPPTPTPTPTPQAPPAPTPGTAPSTPDPGVFDPSAVGSEALAHYRSSGFAYASVITGVRDGGRVDVVYADGDSETLATTELYPEAIVQGTRVEARIRQWTRFFPGTVQRRVAHAVFVRFDDGDEQWTSIGLVRLPAAGLRRDATPATGTRPTGTVPEAGSAVLANYQGQGWYYPAIVAERRADGQVHVIYADGDGEWLAPDRVRPDTLTAGTAVQARQNRQTEVQEGTIARRVGHAVELQLANGTKTWVALMNVRVH